MRAETTEQIKAICLRLLARREHSQKELEEKLKLRGFGVSDSREIIAEMTQQGWQSNSRFAESYIRQRISKGYGPVRIEYELQQKGIADVDLVPVLEEMGCTWQQLIQQVYEGKFSDENHLSFKEWTKRSRFLQQRGFSVDLIKSLQKNLNIKLTF